MQNPTKSVTEPVGKPVATKSNLVDGPVTVTYYAMGGKEAVEKEGLAKKSFDPASGNTRYWLKFATAGMDAGHLYNPQSPTFDATAAKRFESDTGRPRYEFRPVKQEAFDLFMKFLVTNNPINIRNAERSI